MFWWRCARSPLSAATIARVHTSSIGGTGPSIAGTILVALGIGRILVPRDPGTFSAHGTLMTDPHQERSLTRITPVDWDDGTLDLNGGGHAINSRRQAGERIRRFTRLASLGQIRRGYDYSHSKLDQISRQRWQSISLVSRPAINVAGLVQTPPEAGQPGHVRLRRPVV